MKLINELVVSEIEPMINFYKNVFSFEVESIDEEKPPYSWCQMKNGENTIMFITYDKVSKEIKKFPNKSSSSNLLCFEINISLHEMYNQIIKNKTKILSDSYMINQNINQQERLL